MRRREFIAGIGGAAVAWPGAARAQPKTTPVIGFLGSNSPGQSSEQMNAFRQGLSEAGFVEGRNVAIEYRWAEGVYERLPALAVDLVGRKVNVIVAQAPPATRAAKAATATIPIVFGVGIDPVAEGLVASLARPGGNLTGFTLLNTDLAAKQLGLLAELAPQARRFALILNPNNPNLWIGSVQEAARAKGIELQILRAATASEIDAAFETMVQQQAQALVIGEDAFLFAQRRQIAALALRRRIPTVTQFRGFAEEGGLLSYGSSLKDAYRHIGVTTASILKGAKPADIAVRQPTRFEMVINAKTAKALGLDVPPLLLAQADEVIE